MIFQVNEGNFSDCLWKLKQHPYIKHVTPQRLVVRNLDFIDSGYNQVNYFMVSNILLNSCYYEVSFFCY